MSLLMTVLVFIFALALLVKSADAFVHYSARIARRFGISEFVIGLTLVAVGTSLPELANALISSFNGANSLSLGNLVGANVANLCVSLGLATFFARVKVEPKFYQRELLVLAVSTTAFVLAMLDGIITRSEGAVLLVLFVIYLQMVAKVLFDFSRLIDPAELSYFVEHLANLRAKIASVRFGAKSIATSALAQDTLALLISALVLVVSSDMLVNRALEIALAFGTSITGVGATIIAIGTTIPELSVSIASVRKGYYHLLFGNIIGSNIVNLLLIGGLAASITPILVPAVIIWSTVFLVLATIAGIYLLSRRGILSRIVGSCLLAFYTCFLAVSWFA